MLILRISTNQIRTFAGQMIKVKNPIDLHWRRHIYGLEYHRDLQVVSF